MAKLLAISPPLYPPIPSANMYSCTCDNDNCECTEETICQSFENTAGEITDNEYEVNSDKEEEE